MALPEIFDLSLLLAKVKNENKTKYLQKIWDLLLFIYFSAT